MGGVLKLYRVNEEKIDIDTDEIESMHNNLVMYKDGNKRYRREGETTNYVKAIKKLLENVPFAIDAMDCDIEDLKNCRCELAKREIKYRQYIDGLKNIKPVDKNQVELEIIEHEGN